MSTPGEPTKTAIIRGFQLWKAVLDAPDDDSALELILERALELPRADRSHLARVDDDGTVTLVRHSGPEEPPRSEQDEALEAARQAVERHRRRCLSPDDLGTNERADEAEDPRKRTDESIPLRVVAKVLADRERVLGILVVVRQGPAPFSLEQRQSFTTIAKHAAIGLTERHPVRTAAPPPSKTPAAPAPAKPKPAATRRIVPPELAQLKTRCPGLVGAGPFYRKLLDEIVSFASTGLPVLILGESGTGKEVVATAIHHMSGRKGDLCPVNVSAIPAELVEAELFGHTGDAFTGAKTAKLGIFGAAAGGTVFLDEIGDLPLALQPKLLRALETKKVKRVGAATEEPVDFRVVAATNKPLPDLIAAKLFREDLYFRVATFVIQLAPLRDRREDVPLLMDHFARLAGLEKMPPFTREAEELVAKHPFPGNIRQLRQAVERAVALGRRPIPADDLGLAPESSVRRSYASDAERRAHYLEVYDACGQNQSLAALTLGVHRNTLAKYLGLWSRRSRSRGDC